MKNWIFPIFFLIMVFASILPAQTGGYIVAGWTQNYTNGPAGSDWDFLLCSLDGDGNPRWRKNYGGPLQESPMPVLGHSQTLIPTSDGGYLLMGDTKSYVHGTPGADVDILLYKLDAAGRKQWRKNLGGISLDIPKTMIEAPEGGYLIAGATGSFVHGPPGDLDFLVYKLDAAGNKQWRKNFGGMSSDYLSTAQATGDGGYILVGSTYSFTNGFTDFLVYKLDAAGRKRWRKNYGGPDFDPIMPANQEVRLVQTSDGGFALAGVTGSYYHGPPGDRDFLIYKLDGTGRKQWRKNFGGIRDEGNHGSVEMQQTSDGGYVLGGATWSYVHGTPGADADFLIYKLDQTGGKQWRKNYGGIGWEPYPTHNLAQIKLQQTADSGYTLAGGTNSFTTILPNPDFLVYKLDGAGNKKWRRNYGGGYYEPPPMVDGHDLRLKSTADGGYVLAGTSWSYGLPGLSSILVYKLDAAGIIQWREIIGDYYSDIFAEIYEISN